MNTFDFRCRHLHQERGADGYCPTCRATYGNLPTGVMSEGVTEIEKQMATEIGAAAIYRYLDLVRMGKVKLPADLLPTQLRWTTTRPTKDGWYWCKCLGRYGNKEYPTMVKVLNKGTQVFWDGETFNITSSDFREWSDQPIPEPA